MLRNESLEDLKFFYRMSKDSIKCNSQGRLWKQRQAEGVSAEVKLCQPELRSDDCTEADLCAKY